MSLIITTNNRFYRFVWAIVFNLFVRPTPNFMFGWRREIYRMFGSSLSQGSRIYPNTRVWNPSKLIMHEESCIGNDCIIYNVDFVCIGKRSVISQGVKIITASKSMDLERRLIVKPVLIGDDCWVAMEAFLLPGSIIGDRSVVLARVVLNDQIPSDCVVKLLKGYLIEEKKQ